MKAAKTSDKFKTAVEYITDYAGVHGAVVADSEGLVVVQSPTDGFDGELWSALGLNLVKIMDGSIEGMAEPGCEFIAVKTSSSWITIARTSDFYLVVSADRKVDDLLSVRISRALEMIASHLKDKYPAILLKSESARKSERKMEASNV